MEPVRIGVIGCGAISGIYLENLSKFRSTEVIAVADLDRERASKVAERFSIPQVLSTEQLIGSSDIELVLNLTVPKAHASVALAALEAGKHVYNEKPLAIHTREADELLGKAESKALQVGCAPDTFLGGAHQTCRKLIDEGAIGEPVAASAFMLSRGHETWHPSPEFYYEQGGGPMLDMGPYYITALLNMLGPVRRTCGMARASFAQRTITSQPKAGKVVDVETATHISGEMEFENGTIGHITTTFDVYGNAIQPITVYGSEGTILVPDPNGFGGEVLLRRGFGDFERMEVRHGFLENSRGLGVLDMAIALREKRNHRASGELALHALEVMNSFTQSSESGSFVEIQSSTAKPQPLDEGSYRDQLP